MSFPLVPFGNNCSESNIGMWARAFGQVALSSPANGPRYLDMPHAPTSVNCATKRTHYRGVAIDCAHAKIAKLNCVLLLRNINGKKCWELRGEKANKNMGKREIKSGADGLLLQ